MNESTRLQADVELLPLKYESDIAVVLHQVCWSRLPRNMLYEGATARSTLYAC